MYSILSGVKGAEPGLQSGLQGRGHLSSAGITAGQWTLLLTLAQASGWSGVITWPGYWPLIGHSGATTDIQTSRQKASVHKIQFPSPCSLFVCNFICTWLDFFSWEEDEDHMLFSWSYECLWWTCWNVTWSFSWWYFYCFMDHFMLSVYLHSFMVYINTVLQIITGIIWAGGRGSY